MRVGPAGRRSRVRDAARTGPRGEHRYDGRELLGGGLATDDPQHDAGLGVPGARVAAHSGMFPCFFAGSDSRLLRRVRRDRMTAARVRDGWMTASTYPRSAAM